MWLSKIKRMLREPHTAGVFVDSLRSVYSQYGEDIFFRLLFHPRSTGTYLDVGSHEPVHGSNTFNLYARGWRGITIDPNPAFAPAYRKYRPNGVHLVEGVAKEETKLIYHMFERSVFNTISAERAAEVVGFGEKPSGQVVVPCRPLSSIVLELLPNTQIDLLSVDCEGFDLEVLESLEIVSNRPTVVIVEDYERYFAYRDGSARPSAIHDFLSRHEYHSVAQLAFSAIYVARDWRRLMALSSAYDVQAIHEGALPG